MKSPSIISTCYGDVENVDATFIVLIYIFNIALKLIVIVMEGAADPFVSHPLPCSSDLSPLTFQLII